MRSIGRRAHRINRRCRKNPPPSWAPRAARWGGRAAGAAAVVRFHRNAGAAEAGYLCLACGEEFRRRREYHGREAPRAHQDAARRPRPLGPASAPEPALKPLDKAHRCFWAKSDILIEYPDREGGVPLNDDRALFEFLILEGALPGLSEVLVLKMREDYSVE